MAANDEADAGRTKAQPTRAHTPAANDEVETGRTQAQPTRAPAAAGAESRRGGETLPQGTAPYLGPRQGLPQVFGRYRVQKLLGGGGMGAVYLVVNTELEREEALKVPHFEAGDDPAVRERFLREAKSAAGLDHPNLCPVYDVGVLDGIYYLTMRHLKGKLLSVYSGAAQPPRKAVEIVTKLAQALAAAHAKGVIHRDLKPNNIMMCAGVGPVVMDFGLAKQTGRQGRQLTRLGTTLGTPAYMPPEQVKGELDRIGPASDVYSLGVILFELLTGALPFTGRTAEEVYGKILSAEVPVPSSLRPGLPPALDAICAKATAKASEDRYPSMKDFAAALIEYLKAAPPTEGAGNLTPKAKPADIFQVPTLTPASAKTPLRRSEILAAATQVKGKAPSSVAKSGVRQGDLWATVVAGAGEKRGGRSSGTLRGWALCGVLILTGLGALGTLVYVLNQKKSPPPSTVVVTPPLSTSGNEKPVDPEPVETQPADVKPPDPMPSLPPVIVPPAPPVIDSPSPVEPKRLEPMTAESKPPDSAPVKPDEPAPSIVNSIGMKLQLIKQGAFMMGSPKGERGRHEDEGPQHEVEITEAFYLGVYPVTLGQFKAFVEDTGYRTDAAVDGRGGIGYDAAARKVAVHDPKYTWKNPGFAQTDDHPVVNVTWKDAKKFCDWLSKKEEKLYDLPTEAEWEYACRAGTKTRFWSGEDDESLKGAANIADASLKAKADADFLKAFICETWNDGYPFTSPVGIFRPNSWGLCDIHGNVWQWCDDWYGKNYYQESDKKDPKGSNNGRSHVLRGGSWHDSPFFCRSAERFDLDPSFCNHAIGFRVVLRPAARTP